MHAFRTDGLVEVQATFSRSRQDCSRRFAMVDAIKKLPLRKSTFVLITWNEGMLELVFVNMHRLWRLTNLSNFSCSSGGCQ